MKKLAYLTLVLAVGSTNAAVIDFEDIAVSAGSQSVAGDRISGGFTFDLSTDHSHLANNIFDGNSGSTFLVTDDFNGDNDLTMSAIGGSAFSLSSFELGEFDSVGGFATTIDLVGTLLGGGSLTASFTLDGISSTSGSNNFETFTLSGWDNLVSVNFNASAGAGGKYWAIDNIDTASVPEPTSIALLGLGLAGIRLSRKNKDS